jgi:hypothetical protein
MVRRLNQELLGTCRKLLWRLVAAATVFGTTGPADAQLSWMFPCNRCSSRQPTYVVTSSPSTATPYRANYGNWAPSANPNAWCAPQTQYRSLWAQVPVTTFRPVGANCLQPCTSMKWQTRRVPVTAFRPVLTPRVAGPTAGPCGCPMPTIVSSGCSCQPAATPCTSCNAQATTAYYGSTPAYSAWQTVAPSTGNMVRYAAPAVAVPVTPYATVAPAPTCAAAAPPSLSAITSGQAVTAGYVPQGGSGTTSAGYGSATPWTPVDSARPDSARPDGARPDSVSVSPDGQVTDPNASGSNWQTDVAPTNHRVDGSAADTTPWLPVESGSDEARESTGERAPDSSVESPSKPTPADIRPSLSQPGEDDSPAYPTREEFLRPQIDEPTTEFDDMRNQDADAPTTRTGSSRRNTPPLNEQFVPFQRPIPDPDRNNNWDFDDKFQLRDRPLRSALRSNSRWEAIPVRATLASKSPREARYRGLGEDDQLVPPPRHPANEGGWHSSAR